jgi:peptidoglycan/LPS O-acetylase OafA/YrhL
MEPLEYRIPREDRGAEPALWPISRRQLNLTIAFVSAALSAVSLFVVVQGANDEPYMGYRRYDAVVQVGLGTALIVLWGCCSVAVLVLVRKKKLSAAWLALLLWAAICLFYLSSSPLGYLEDMERFVIPPTGGG